MFGKNWCLEAWSEITEVTKKLLFVVCKFVFSLGIYVVKFRYGEKLRDLKYGHAEWGINMCFIYSILIYSQYASVHANKQLVKIVTVLWSHNFIRICNLWEC